LVVTEEVLVGELLMGWIQVEFEGGRIYLRLMLKKAS